MSSSQIVLRPIEAAERSALQNGRIGESRAGQTFVASVALRPLEREGRLYGLITVGRDGQIRLSYTDNNQEGHKRLLRKLTSLLGSLGCHEHLIPHELVRGQRIPIAGVAHQCGTVRFGDDPMTSALNTDCRAHELDNLYVVDTSFFPSSGAVNPALTAMANALRVGDHLIDRLGARRDSAELQEVAS